MGKWERKAGALENKFSAKITVLQRQLLTPRKMKLGSRISCGDDSFIRHQRWLDNVMSLLIDWNCSYYLEEYTTSHISSCILFKRIAAWLESCHHFINLYIKGIKDEACTCIISSHHISIHITKHTSQRNKLSQKKKKSTLS